MKGSAIIVRWKAGQTIQTLSLRSIALFLLTILFPGLGSPLWACTPLVTDLTSARARSLADGRLVMLFFFDDSRFSTQEKAVLRQLRVLPAMCTSFIFVEREVTSPESSLVHQFDVKLLPAISIFSTTSASHLTEVTRFEGLHSFRELRDTIAVDTCEAASAGEITLPLSISVALHCAAGRLGKTVQER